MKKFIALIFISLRLTSLAQSNNTNYTLNLKLIPSFIYASKLVIHSGRDSSWIQLEMYKHYKDVTPIFTKKVQVQAQMLTPLTDFFNTYKFRDNTSLDSIVTYKINDKGDSVRVVTEIMGNDGIIVYGTMDQDKTIRKFEFWSPNKGTANDKLSKILLDILYTAFQDQTSVEYFELLEQYFPHGLGVKKISDVPLKYKLYGSIDSDDDSAIENFFESLPHDKKVFIDMSNFSGMGTMYDDVIEDYVSANKKIYWVNPTDPALRHLYDAGVRNSHIISKRKIRRIKEEKDGRRKIIYKN